MKMAILLIPASLLLLLSCAPQLQRRVAVLEERVSRLEEMVLVGPDSPAMLPYDNYLGTFEEFDEDSYKEFRERALPMPVTALKGKWQSMTEPAVYQCQFMGARLSEIVITYSTGDDNRITAPQWDGRYLHFKYTNVESGDAVEEEIFFIGKDRLFGRFVTTDKDGNSISSVDSWVKKE